MKNAVLTKELRGAARSSKLSWGLFLFNSILAFMAIAVFRLNFFLEDSSVSISYSNIIGMFSWIEVAEFVLLAFIVPAITANAISGEREKKTLEILLTTPLSTLQIIWGKLIASVGTILLYIVSGLPILSIVYFIGGVNLGDIVLMIFYSFVFAIFIGSIGVFFSTICRKTVFATIVTYAVSIVIYGLPYIAYWAGYWIHASEAYANDIGYEMPGWLVPLGLLSPVDSIISLQGYQLAGDIYYRSYNLLGINEDSIWQCTDSLDWFWLSVVVQLAVSIVLLLLSSRLLEPLKRK